VADDSKEQHSKERTKAEAQFKQAQKPQPATLPTTKAGRAKELLINLRSSNAVARKP
jgi:hypothetical protein